MRTPAVSGRFYPGTKRELERAVRELLEAVPPTSPTPARAAVAPHAGYAYSGLTAAHVFARLDIPPVVVILAPNHTGVCAARGGASLWEAGAFRTPLGDVPVDEPLAAALLEASALVGVDHTAHAREHAVEVEVPFLQVRRPDVRIVPLVLAWDAWDGCRRLGRVDDTLYSLSRASRRAGPSRCCCSPRATSPTTSPPACRSGRIVWRSRPSRR